MSFRLDQHGAVFSTRPRGRTLRQQAMAEHARGQEIHVSFEGVQSISYSFADEFLGPLMLGPDRVVLEDVPPQLHRIIKSTLSRRGIRLRDDSDLFAITA
ncbi:MAG TPA: DUF4325 domain-containing protein [Solirubrobacterales bacterium]|jgi:hypothetical protein|nr:DUF4325 domain-containing protein [Solirubrobacterales bacterium]